MKKSLPLAILFALCAAACSSGQESTASTTTNSEQTTTAVTISDQTAPTVPLDEFVSPTTGNLETHAAVDVLAKQLVEAWWYPTTPTTYSQLADDLETKGLITTDLATQWRTQGSQTITPAPETTEIIKMWTVRAAEDNATFQISALTEGATEETLTFIEFVQIDDSWKASEIA